MGMTVRGPRWLVGKPRKGLDFKMKPLPKFNVSLFKWAIVPMLAFLLAGLVTHQLLRAKRGGNESQYQKDMGESIQKLDSGDRAGALDHLKSASGFVPNDPQKNLDLAQKFEALGDRRQAAEQLEKMLRHRPGGPNVTNYARLAEYYLNQGDTDSARRILNAVLIPNWPNTWPTEFVHGIILLKEAKAPSDIEYAAEHFRKSAELNGDHLPSKTQLGIAYWRLGQLDKAEPLLRAVLASEPSTLVAMYHLGEVLRQLGRPEEAAKFLAEHQRITALEQRRKHLEVQHGLGRDQPADVLELGMVYEQLGELSSAAKTFRAYTQLKPADPGGHRKLASVCQKLGDKEGVRISTELADALTQVAAGPAVKTAHE